MIHRITLRDIEESNELRASLLDENDGNHIMDNNLVMEVQKVYESRGA